MSSYTLQIPSVLNFVTPSTILVRGGLTTKSIQPFTPTAQSSVNLSFSSNLTVDFVLDRFWYIKYTIGVDFQHPSTPSMTEIGFRAFPLNRACTSAVLNLGSQSFQSAPFKHVDLLLDYWEQYTKQYMLGSGCPSYKDMRQEYSEAGMRSEFQLRDQQMDGWQNHGRNVLPQIDLIDLGGGSWRLQGTFREPIFLSPLLSLTDDQQGFYGLDQFSLNLTFSGLSKDIVCCSSSDYDFSGTGSTYSLSGTTLRIPIYTPSQHLSIPQQLFYNSPLITRYDTVTGAPIAPGGSDTGTAANVQLNGVPNVIAITVQEADNQRDHMSTDTFLTINKLSVTLGNNSGQLASFDSYDLWKLCTENGYSDIYPNFLSEGTVDAHGNKVSTGRGSSIMLIPGKDIFSDNTEIGPGMDGNYNLGVQVEYSNGSGRTVQAPSIKIYTVYFNKVMVDTSDSTIQVQKNYITPETKMAVYNQGSVAVHTAELIQGGFSFGDLLKTVSPIVRTMAPKVMKALSPMAGVIPYVGPAVSGALGIGGEIADRANTALDPTLRRMGLGARPMRRRRR